MNEKAEPVPDELLEQAGAWLYRLDAAPADPSLRAAWQAWLETDERHLRAWQLARRAWVLAGRAAPSRGMREAGPPVRGRTARLAVAALALAACMALVVALPALKTWFESDFATATGESREVALADGSTVLLGADSAISIAFGPDLRVLNLLRGEAFFQVSADRARPFLVRAGELTVTVTGTAFDVTMSGTRCAVAVASGTVTVAAAGAAPIVLSSGQRVAVDRQAGSVERGAILAAEVAGWREGRLAVEEAAFDDVVDTFRRYHRGAIVIADPELAQRRVTGVYDLRDPARALRALGGPFGSVVREVTPFLIVVTAF